MAKVKALKLDRPRCEAIRSYNYGNETGATDRRCKHLAKYEIGEKQLCEKHASMEALSILLNKLDAQGYEVVPLGELLKEGQGLARTP